MDIMFTLFTNRFIETFLVLKAAYMKKIMEDLRNALSKNNTKAIQELFAKAKLEFVQNGNVSDFLHWKEV